MRPLLMILVALAVLSTVPSAHAAKKEPLTPMQLQAMQQKEFEAQKPTVFSSVMDVFQDLGYTVNSADVNTGFITAESAMTNKTSFWEALGEMSSHGNTRATAFVEQMPSGRTRVRLNFVSTKKMSGSYGWNTQKDKPIQEPLAYQRAFEKIDEALFVRKATNAATPVSTPAVAAPAPAPTAPSPSPAT